MKAWYVMYQELLAFLREHLTIEIENKCEGYYSSQEKAMHVILRLDGEVISRDHAHFTEGTIAASDYY